MCHWIQIFDRFRKKMDSVSGGGSFLFLLFFRHSMTQRWAQLETLGKFLKDSISSCSRRCVSGSGFLIDSEKKWIQSAAEALFSFSCFFVIHWHSDDHNRKYYECFSKVVFPVGGCGDDEKGKPKGNFFWFLLKATRSKAAKSETSWYGDATFPFLFETRCASSIGGD